jgi:hypothetical protein
VKKWDVALLICTVSRFLVRKVVVSLLGAARVGRTLLANAGLVQRVLLICSGTCYTAVRRVYQGSNVAASLVSAGAPVAGR